MQLKNVLLGTFAYTAVTFPLAAVWHAALFSELYHSMGYFDGEPRFLLGLMSIFIQGLVLSALFPYVDFKGSWINRGIKYSLLIGIFFWTSHVLAFIAKQTIQSPLIFVAIETLYLLLQFGTFGVLIGLIHRGDISASA